ncbi:iron-containing alcohol dehydrogenase [endosymbiont 'TC1' of Trimyema compressum]|uniref:iron-containing alcohol dehydrogenase n=1 Tax=endosymbiont 'TC1' of Trimyema compressum TaxID=243899 RepID=UPI000A6E9574
MLIAVPTTAGTGGETTIAAVVVDSKTKEKYAISDSVLVPKYAILDPCLTIGLPRLLQVTGFTGMDALCYAVEAYIGQSSTKETGKNSLEAVKLIFQNLEKAFLDGQDVKVREAMLWAAFIAGKAFTRAYVGNIHALAHPLGGYYGIPHGLANAVIMPYVLEYYGDLVVKPLSQLSDVIGLGIGADNKTKARLFIEAIKSLNNNLGIPDKLEGIKISDIPLMADYAFHEANPFCPAPKIFSKNEFEKIYAMIKK